MRKLNSFIGKNVHIKLQHKLFGTQTARVKNFQPIFTESEFGFRTNSQFISFQIDEMIYKEIENGVQINDQSLYLFITE